MQLGCPYGASVQHSYYTVNSYPRLLRINYLVDKPCVREIHLLLYRICGLLGRLAQKKWGTEAMIGKVKILVGNGGLCQVS